MFLIYDLLLLAAYALLRFASICHDRLKLNFALRAKLPDFSAAKAKKHIWFHAASAGEFEQARAIAIEWQKLDRNAFFSFSYSSDSAFRAKKNDQIPNVFFALPFDFSWRMKSLIRAMKPDALIVAKYDAWPNQVKEAHKAQVPVYLASATLPAASLRHKVFFRNLLAPTYKRMRRIFAVNEEHAARLRKISRFNVEVLGDTRFDAIAARLADNPPMPVLSGKVIVAGSTYLASEKMLVEFLKKDRRFTAVIAPHHVNSNRLAEIEVLAEEAGLSISRLSSAKKTRIVLVDTLGILPHLYRLAEVAYVGGGLQGSVHSVIEAAAFGVPVITGPHIANSAEALELCERDLLARLDSAEPVAFQSIVENLCRNRPKKAREIQKYFRERLGVAKKIVHTVMDDLKQKY